MTLVVFVLVAFAAAGAALLVRARPAAAAVIGIGGLVALIVVASGLDPAEAIVIGDGSLAVSGYTRMFLVLGSASGLGLAVAGLLRGSGQDAPAATLAILGACALTLSLTDARAAVLAGTLAGLFGVVVTLAPPGRTSGSAVGIREVRAVVVAGALAIAATAWFGRDLGQLAAQPAVFGLAYLAFAVAVAIRFGAIPFHLWAARLADAAPETALPILTAMAPAAFALVALAWIDASVAPLLVDLGAARAVIVVIAVASIVLAALAALVQEDVEHVVGYSIVGDAGIIVLALAVLDPAAWAPARIWVMAFVVGRAAFAAWAAGIRVRFSTGTLDDLRGWAASSPILAVALGLVALAAVGFPGLLAFDARTSVVGLALDGPVAVVVFVATLLPALYYARLFVVGLSRPGPDRALDGRGAVPPDVDEVPEVAGGSAAGARTTTMHNRAFGAAVIATLMATLALATAAGAFGLPEAAAGSPQAPRRRSRTSSRRRNRRGR